MGIGYSREGPGQRREGRSSEIETAINWIRHGSGTRTLSVYAVQVARWMTKRALGTPTGLLWLLFCAVNLPVLALFTPHGFFEHSREPEAPVAQMASLAALFGASLAMGAMEDSAWILRRCGPGRRVIVHWMGIATSVLLGGCLVFGSAWISSGIGGSTLVPLFWPFLLGAGHLTLVAGILLEAPVQSMARGLLLFLLVWLLPGLIQAQDTPFSWAMALLRVHPSGGPSQVPTPGEFLAQLGPILALGGLHALFLISRHSTPTVQA